MNQRTNMRFFAVLAALVSICSHAATPNDILFSSAAWQGVSDRNLQVAQTYLLMAQVGLSTPNQVMSNAAAFQALSDRDLLIAQTYLLSQLSGNSNATFSGTTRLSSVIITNAGTGTTVVNLGLDSSGNVVSNATPVGSAYVLGPLTTASSASPANGTTYYFGGDPAGANNTTYGIASIDVPKTGIVRRLFVKVRTSGTLASNQGVVHSLRLNDTTDFASMTVTFDVATTNFVVSGLSQAVTAGDTLVLKVVTPTWGTLPTSVRWYALAYIE